MAKETQIIIDREGRMWTAVKGKRVLAVDLRFDTVRWHQQRHVNIDTKTAFNTLPELCDLLVKLEEAGK